MNGSWKTVFFPRWSHRVRSDLCGVLFACSLRLPWSQPSSRGTCPVSYGLLRSHFPSYSLNCTLLKTKLNYIIIIFSPKSLIAQVWHCQTKQPFVFSILQNAFMFFLFCFNSLVEVVCGNNVVNCLLSPLDWQLSRLGESITVTVLENSPSACVLIWQ